MYAIEIIASKSELYPPIEVAIRSLNTVQSQFSFYVVEARLQPEAFTLNHSRYKTRILFEWLSEFRIRNKGKRDFIILVVDTPIDGDKYGNLFGNLSPDDGLAIFTTQRFNQFIHNLPRYCMYYCIRYALSFLAPHIRSHESVNCMFDNKIYKRDLLLSMNSGNICDACKTKLQPVMTPEIQHALDSMLKLVSDNYPLALVMKGGGVKGLAYAGALLVLEHYFSFDVFVGTSAGAIAAVLLGADYSPTEIELIFREIDFQRFKDAGAIKSLYNLVTKKGLYPGDVLGGTIESLLYQKTKRSLVPLSDLSDRTIIYATQKGVGTITFDSHGERRETSASFAARCSMSIPVYFIPPTIGSSRVYDGGLKNNFPTYRFKSANPHKPFLGLYLYTPPAAKQGVFSELIDIITDAEDYEIYKDHQNRIVLINTGPIKTTDFNLTDEKKAFLLATGKLAAVEFIKTHYPDFDSSMYDLAVLEKDAATKRDLIRTQCA